MSKSLLSHIASNFISEYENVANSSVCYLLNKYPQAQVALGNLLGIERVPVSYVTELPSAKSKGRPDVTGIDIQGNKPVIIEGKFWANLTPNQPESYLKELSKDGKLLFLAPDKRLTSLKHEIDIRVVEKNENIILNSWENFIQLIEKENTADFDAQLASDLSQLRELCNRMDTEGMPPLSLTDLDPMNGRIASNFADIIDECNSLLRDWEHSDFSGLKTQSNKYGHGFYFRAYELTCYLSYDSYAWFSSDNHAPFWLEITDKDWNISQKINHFLKLLESENADGNKYGIVLLPGMDKEQVVTHITSKVKDILIYLDHNTNND
jgi:hypothetical protein